MLVISAREAFLSGNFLCNAFARTVFGQAQIEGHRGSQLRATPSRKRCIYICVYLKSYVSRLDQVEYEQQRSTEKKYD